MYNTYSNTTGPTARGLTNNHPMRQIANNKMTGFIRIFDNLKKKVCKLRIIPFGYIRHSFDWVSLCLNGWRSTCWNAFIFLLGAQMYSSVSFLPLPLFSPSALSLSSCLPWQNSPISLLAFVFFHFEYFSIITSAGGSRGYLIFSSLLHIATSVSVFIYSYPFSSLWCFSFLRHGESVQPVGHATDQFLLCATDASSTSREKKRRLDEGGKEDFLTSCCSMWGAISRSDEPLITQ